MLIDTSLCTSNESLINYTLKQFKRRNNDITKSKNLSFKTTEENNFDVCKDLDLIKESFCYLFVGHWLQGELGQDRKDVGMMIKTFLETFRNKIARVIYKIVIKLIFI